MSINIGGSRWTRPRLGRTVGYVFVVAASSFALALGDHSFELIAYAVAIAFGVVVYRHAGRYGTRETYLSALGGFLAGVGVSEAVATALVVWYFAAPLDAAAWLMAVRLLFGWVAVLFCVVAGFFVAGLVQLLE